MKKGDLTRQAILGRAVEMASSLGLEGLTIGDLADRLSLSKSGLFAHFRSKEALQIQVLDAAAQRFVDLVIRPALQAPRGEARVRALFERWLVWSSSEIMPGGCVFVGASFELDDRPGPVRDHLVKLQRDWFETRARVFQAAIEAGHLKADADPEQLSQDMFSIALGCHYAKRLLKDPKAETRARRAFEAMLDGARPKKEKP
jgi:AcrR family transcriptional regulator